MISRFFLIFTFILPSFGTAFAADAAKTLGTYENYQANVDNYCKLQMPGLAGTNDLWSQWQSQSLIKSDVPYPKIGAVQGDSRYKQFLTKLGSDSWKIDAIGLASQPGYLEKASYVYSETMGSIFSCAVLNAKLKITQGLLSNNSIQTGRSNIKDDLQKQITLIKKRLGSGYCPDITTKPSDLSMKKVLLDNAMYQYCTYRYYLYYLDDNAKNSTDEFFLDKNAPKQSGNSLVSSATNMISGIAETTGKMSTAFPPDTEVMTERLKDENKKIQTEIMHAKEIFPQALVAYTEFERTYASHIVLTLILQDYIELRDTLKKMLNPIGQVIYKASNAQSPGPGSK